MITKDMILDLFVDSSLYAEVEKAETALTEIKRFRVGLAEVVRNEENLLAKKATQVRRYKKEVELVEKYMDRLISLMPPEEIPKMDDATLTGVRKTKIDIKDAVLSAAKPMDLTVRSGVYFLIDDAEIVYIGQSVSVPNRLQSHHSDPNKTFDSVCYIPMCREYLDKIEALLIVMFKPRYNKQGVNRYIHGNTKMNAGSGVFV